MQLSESQPDISALAFHRRIMARSFHLLLSADTQCRKLPSPGFWHTQSWTLTWIWQRSWSDVATDSTVPWNTQDEGSKLQCHQKTEIESYSANDARQPTLWVHSCPSRLRPLQKPFYRNKSCLSKINVCTFVHSCFKWERKSVLKSAFQKTACFTCCMNLSCI